MVHGFVKRGFLSSLSSVTILAAFAFSVLLPARTHGQDLARHFDGKVVTIIVGASPGGGYDIFSRLVARSVPKYLPGNPTFVVKNIPGGGQLRGLRAAMRSKPDGLTIGLLHQRFVSRELIGKDVPDFDLDTVRVIGSPSGGAKRQRMVCARRDVANSWDEVLKLGRPITSGALAPGGSSSLGPEFVQLVGGPMKVIFGYGGGSEIMAAFDRGELDATERCTEEYVPRLFPGWIEKKILAPLFWWESKPADDWLQRIGATLPPHITEVVNATQEQKKAFELGVLFGTVISRVFVMPPGVPDDIYHAVKKAFEATVNDPDFLKGADVAGLEVGLATAEDFKRTIREYRELSPAGKEVLKKLIGET